MLSWTGRGWVVFPIFSAFFVASLFPRSPSTGVTYGASPGREILAAVVASVVLFGAGRRLNQDAPSKIIELDPAQTTGHTFCCLRVEYWSIVSFVFYICLVWDKL